MKAITWHGKGDMRCESVPDPKIEHPRDAIIKVTACAICGSDLHLMNGVIPSMHSGDIVGHETMGEVVEVGSADHKLKIGDRVVVPLTISCGECFFCQRGFFSGCERSNPNAARAAKLWGHSPAGLDHRMCAFRVPGTGVSLLFQVGGSLQPSQTPGGVIPPHGGRGELRLCFAIPVAALDAWVSHLAAQQVPIESRVVQAFRGTSLYFRDPDGHSLEVASPGLWPNY